MTSETNAAATPQTDLVIETRGLTKRFGTVTAVTDLSLEVPRGGVFGLLGPNGSGKTTTMVMLLGLVQPTEGSYKVLGHDGSPVEVLRRIGAIVETPAFYPYLTGRANLRYFQGIGRRGAPREIERLLEQVDLATAADRKYATYSLGMKQRLGVAYALLGAPDLMFLDEPTNGLDPSGMAEMRALIRELGAGGRTVILSSHLLNEVELLCDRVAVLSRGRLIAQGRVQDLLRHEGVMRLATTDDVMAHTVLDTLPWVADVTAQGGYLLATAPPERAWELTRALAERQIYVKEISAVGRSLEQYFLDVTSDPITPDSV